MTTFVAAMLALPFVALPIATILRARRSRSLADESPVPRSDAPLVSLVIPARNEARSIGRCVRSALAADYPRLEVVAVDDHSTDSTGDILRSIAAGDSRLRLVVPPPLPPGWFGKQWACATGADACTGEIIGFLDADTTQAPDLVPRVVNAMLDANADMVTIGGRQELGSFWERLVQPQVFAVMLTRYGGTEIVNNSRRASDKIANGQCIFVSRLTYAELDGHVAVRDKAAEDLALAQLWFTRGKRVVLLLGLEQLSTRMYTSLREIIDGWGKNVYAAGRSTIPFGVAGRVVFPLVLLMPGLCGIVPPVLLILALAGWLGHGVLVWSAIVSASNLAFWLAVYLWLGESPLYALLSPLGSAMLVYIFGRSVARGRRVEWKGREYLVE
ncbi:MAG: glycosyltransferase [Gemmatimonadota bacterium]